MHAVIVTGVSRGLGEALAAALLARGARSSASAARRASSSRARAFAWLPAISRIRQLIAAASRRRCARSPAAKPTAVTLINNAAVATPVGLIGRLDAAAIESAFATNVAAPLVMADLFCRAFPETTPPRRIINVSSGAAQSAIAGSAAYCMSKAALEMLTRALVADHAATSLECITLRPGIFETGMQAFMRSRDPAEFPSVGLFRGFKENGLLKDPADVARAIVDKLVLAQVENGRTYTHTDL